MQDPPRQDLPLPPRKVYLDALDGSCVASLEMSALSPTTEAPSTGIPDIIKWRDRLFVFEGPKGGAYYYKEATVYEHKEPQPQRLFVFFECTVCQKRTMMQEITAYPDETRKTQDKVKAAIADAEALGWRASNRASECRCPEHNTELPSEWQRA